MSTPSYNSRYSSKTLYWGNKPHSLVVALKKLLPVGSSILDLGCGEGQNAIHLAQNGFKVTAIDISKPGIDKLKAIAKQKKVKIVAKVADVIKYVENDAKFDAIICMNVLQFIPANKIKRVVKRIQAKTKKNGYITIASFVAQNPEQKQKAISNGRYCFDKYELKKYFAKWNIIKYIEKWTPWETHGEPRHRHYIVQLIAKG
ncbi:MAG: methyltransferase domain-containing protein [Patescibacteria group bacterium]|jgi:tellurite methyltransferase